MNPKKKIRNSCNTRRQSATSDPVKKGSAFSAEIKGNEWHRIHSCRSADLSVFVKGVAAFCFQISEQLQLSHTNQECCSRWITAAQNLFDFVEYCLKEMACSRQKRSPKVSHRSPRDNKPKSSTSEQSPLHSAQNRKSIVIWHLAWSVWFAALFCKHFPHYLN